jgi:WD40 repeat protein
MSSKSDEQTPGDERARLDVTGEFFSVGTPLHAVRAGYVRRVADNVLYETIISGRYAHVIAPDRSGKSSLIAATAVRLENNGHKVAILDLEQIGVREAGSDAGRWYYNVAYRLLRQLRIKVDLQTWWQDKSMLSNRQRLLEFYSEIVLPNVQERVVVFVDEIQCIGELSFGDQLLASFRAAHNARAVDPEFARLTFVLLGECDPLSLLAEAELSPFNVTQAVTLADFTRDELDLFITELNLSAENARSALDRIYYWTSGQPYLSQKLARSISREQLTDDIAANVDRIAMQQLAGRAGLHNEPHMSHIHRAVVNDVKRRETLLNLYGRICKNVAVATDLGSPAQRRLIAIGLIVIDDEGRLKIRNRLYASVFTTRWANENLPNDWRAPAVAALAVMAIVAVPFWYTQILPRSYVAVLTTETSELAVAERAFESFRTFPGHVEAADNLYRIFLQSRASAATDIAEIATLSSMAEQLPDAGRLPLELVASFWDRKMRAATRLEQRDQALLATIESLLVSTPRRRNRAAALVSSDYPLLIASLPATDRGTVVFNPGSMLLTATKEAQVSQWSLGDQELQQRDDWTISALEVSPLVRRVIVDRDETVRRAGLTINLSHARVNDLRIKVIAPSGRTVEIDPGVDRASSIDDIQISTTQLHDLLGESITGTWSLSVRDEELGVAGQLVGWNLQLNSQGLVEDFQRGLNISDPVERDTDNIWFGRDGRFAVARATQSDSARIWDLAFAKPVRAIAVSELEQVIGLSADARQLVTATQDTVNLWDTATGDRAASLPVGAASSSSVLTDDGEHLFVQRRSDLNTTFELWSLSDASITASLDVAGTPALASLDPTGSRIAIADYDRAVRIWDLRSAELLAQIDLAEQPSSIELAAGGQVLGAVLGEAGASLWRIDETARLIFEELNGGNWQLAFSPSGTKVLLGRPDHGFQVYSTSDGQLLGPAVGSGDAPGATGLLAFSADEQSIVTGGPNTAARFWRAPAAKTAGDLESGDFSHVWPPAGDAVAVATPDATTIVIGDRQGDVHMLSATGGREAIFAESEDISFLGHSQAVRRLVVSADGASVASAADDNSVRVWETATGLPLTFFGGVTGNPIERIAFSPDASMLGILSSNRVQVMDAADGTILAHFELGESHQSLAFANNDQLYVGSENGTLRALSRDGTEEWNLQTVWQGNAAIRMLEASPKSRFLIMVNQENFAQQFILAEGKLGDQSLQLPGRVEEVSFAPGGSRVLFRTSRWLHRASSSVSGLRWLDAVFAPRSIGAARIVFGDTSSNTFAASGTRVFLPVAGEGYVQLAELSFDAGNGPALFGNNDELLMEWRRRLGQD